MNRSSLSSLLLLILLAACGGNVVVDSPPSGTGGAGLAAGGGSFVSDGGFAGSTLTSGGGTGVSTGGFAGGVSVPPNVLVCPNNLCDFGDSGYAFAYSDSENVAPDIPGTSTATLATNGALCISGEVMQLPPNPTQADYSNDWGCGIGIDLNQPGGDAGPAAYQLTGSGVTVTVANLPTCTEARVVLDQNGATPNYCATLTSGVEIPWSAFSTDCWDSPPTGAVLNGPPDTQQIKVQFVTSTAEPCPFTNFCITALTL